MTRRERFFYINTRRYIAWNGRERQGEGSRGVAEQI